MSRIANQSIALAAAFFIAFTSIGTIVTVPPAQAAAPIGQVHLA